MRPRPKGNSYVKKQRKKGRARILLLVVCLILLALLTNFRETREAQPALQGLHLNAERKQRLFAGYTGEFTQFEVFSYVSGGAPWLRLSCYALDREGGSWQYLRGSELRLEGERGKFALAFDAERVLWALFLNEAGERFAALNPEERDLGVRRESAFWWRKGRTPIEEGLEFAIAVQTIFTEDAPEGAVPIDPRLAHDPAAFSDRSDIDAAYAVTVCFLSEEADAFGGPRSAGAESSAAPSALPP